MRAGRSGRDAPAIRSDATSARIITFLPGRDRPDSPPGLSRSIARPRRTLRVGTSPVPSSFSIRPSDAAPARANVPGSPGPSRDEKSARTNPIAQPVENVAERRGAQGSQTMNPRGRNRRERTQSTRPDREGTDVAVGAFRDPYKPEARARRSPRDGRHGRAPAQATGEI